MYARYIRDAVSHKSGLLLHYVPFAIHGEVFHFIHTMQPINIHIEAFRSELITILTVWWCLQYYCLHILCLALWNLN